MQLGGRVIRIVTDSVASIPREQTYDLDVQVVSLHVHHNGQSFVDAEMDVDEFYKHIGEMIDNIPSSSQPSTHDFETVFNRIAQEGDELLGIFMSARMSGTVDAATRAAESVAAQHPGFRYSIIDSTTNSYDEAFSVLVSAQARDEGCTLEECTERALHAVESSRFLFTPESLVFLKNGGRIGSAAALLATLIKIRPIITVSDGESATFARIRTTRKALASIAKKLREDAAEFKLKDIVVHYIGSSDKAREWAKSTIEPIAKRAVPVLPVSPVIGCHVGPAVGVAYRCGAALPGKISYSVSRLLRKSW